MISAVRSAASAASVVMLVLLCACAESATTPDTVTALAPAARTSLRIANLTDEAAPGVAVADYDLQRLLERLKAEVGAVRPDIWAPAGTAGAVNVKVIITQYDEGSAVGRAMLIGLGQIHLEGDIIFSDASNGQQIAEYKVSKDFAFGGIYGGTTTMADVEKGFAKSVAEILETKQSSILSAMQRG